MLAGAVHAKSSIDALMAYAHHMSQLMENMNLCSDTLVATNDEYVALHAAKEWGLPVSNLQYT